MNSVNLLREIVEGRESPRDDSSKDDTAVPSGEPI